MDAAAIWLGVGFAGYLCFVLIVAIEDDWKAAWKVVSEDKLASAIVCAVFTAGGPLTALLAIRAALKSRKVKFFWNRSNI